MIKLISVDDRLLHGKIAFFWTQYLKLNKIIIINSEAANDEFTKMVLELAKPKEVELIICELEEGYKIIKQDFYNENSRTLVILGNLFDSSKLFDYFDYSFKQINLCGLRMRPNSIQLNEKISLTVEDVTVIKKMINKNILVTVRTNPNDKELELSLKDF